MADQYQFAGLAQAGQAAGYPQFQYPSANGDQNAHFLQGYALAQQANGSSNVPGGMFGSQSVGSFSIDQNNPVAYSQATGVPHLGASQMQMNAGLGANFPYGDYPQFNQYGSMGPGVGGMSQSLSDIQQFGQLLPNAFNQSAGANLYDAFAQDQGLAGFNPAAFLQDPTGAMARNLGGFPGKGFGLNQRGGMNKFGNGGRSTCLPSVTNPDGLREDTIFVSNLPQNIDHEVMKTHFSAMGKIKVNSKTGMPMIWIFKERGVPKGDALVTYEDPNCIHAAIKWFSEHDFMGKQIEVKQAKNSQRPVIIAPGGGGNNMMNNSTNNAAAALAAAAVAAAASGNTMSSLMNNSAAAAASLAALTGVAAYNADKHDMGIYGQLNAVRDGRNVANVIRSGGNAPTGNRAGDWLCPGCNNMSFGWRDRCKQCSTSRPDDLPSNGMIGMGVGCPPNIMQGRGGHAHGGAGGICVVNSNANGMGRGNSGNLPPNMQGVSVIRGGRGGGPMRGSAVNSGRIRHTPY